MFFFFFCLLFSAASKWITKNSHSSRVLQSQTKPARFKVGFFSGKGEDKTCLMCGSVHMSTVCSLSCQVGAQTFPLHNKSTVSPSQSRACSDAGRGRGRRIFFSYRPSFGSPCEWKAVFMERAHTVGLVWALRMSTALENEPHVREGRKWSDRRVSEGVETLIRSWVTFKLRHSWHGAQGDGEICRNHNDAFNRFQSLPAAKTSNRG